MLLEPENQSTLTRAALSTSGRAKSKFLSVRLQAAGCDNDPHCIAEQRYFTAGRIISHGPTARWRPG